MLINTGSEFGVGDHPAFIAPVSGDLTKGALYNLNPKSQTIYHSVPVVGILLPAPPKDFQILIPNTFE